MTDVKELIDVAFAKLVPHKNRGDDAGMLSRVSIHALTHLSEQNAAKDKEIAELTQEVREARKVVSNGLDLVNDHDEAHDIHDPLYIWRNQAEVYLRPETAGFPARQALSLSEGET